MPGGSGWGTFLGQGLARAPFLVLLSLSGDQSWGSLGNHLQTFTCPWLGWPCSGLEGAGGILPALPEPPRGREHPPCPALGRWQPLWGPWFPGAAQGQVGPGGPSGKWGGFWISPAPSQPRARASSCREVQGACLPPQPRLPALLGLASRAGPRLPNGFPMCFSVDKVAAFNRPSPLGDFPIGTAGAASSLGPALGSVPRAGAGRRFPAAVQVGRVQQRESFSGLPCPSQKRVFGNKNCRAGE